jgi:hypothetical protein
MRHVVCLTSSSVALAAIALRVVGLLFQPLMLLAVVAATLSAPPAASAAGQDGNTAFLEQLSLDPKPVQILTVCHGFGCTYRDLFTLTPERIARLQRVLGQPRSAREEREAIGRAVAWFDREGGRVASTIGRIAYASASTASGPGQMDCIDLTANVTELLLVLQHTRLMRFHRLGEQVSRGFIIDGRRPHTTPVIVEIAEKREWSVDSWTKAYGQIPDIMTIAEWRNRN